MPARCNMGVTAIRGFAITVFLAGCSGNPSAAHAATSERESNAPESASAPGKGRVATVQPAEGALKGDAIVAWFRRRGAETPGALNLEDSLCETVSAPVPSGQALSCEQHAAIEPLVRVSRRILFDVRDGRALVLVNLAAKVEPFDPSSGSGGHAREHWYCSTSSYRATRRHSRSSTTQAAAASRPNGSSTRAAPATAKPWSSRHAR